MSNIIHVIFIIFQCIVSFLVVSFDQFTHLRLTFETICNIQLIFDKPNIRLRVVMSFGGCMGYVCKYYSKLIYSFNCNNSDYIWGSQPLRVHWDHF